MTPNALRGAVGAIRAARIIDDTIVLYGGLDQVTPTMQKKPGYCRRAQNYEASINGGYRRIAGYERFDGRVKPSAAQYGILNVTITGSFSPGNIITGVTSGATAVVIAVVTGAGSYLAITKIVGTFVSGETLNVGGSGQGTTTSTVALNAAPTQQLHASYKNLAADQYRTDILAIPGSGAVLGIWRYNGVTFGFRNNAGGTAAAIYKSTSAGWVNVPLGEEVSFTAGNSNVNDGDTLTQGAVTATIKRAVVTSGTSPNLVGRLVIFARAGGSFGAGAATSTGGGALTLSGVQTAITLAPSGRYEFITSNFGGSTSTRRVYGCDRVNRGFEFDGSDFGYVPISTGMVTDAPEHVLEHKKQLFFSFGPSAQHSGPGLPYQWSPIVGAGELAMGDDITGFMVQPGFEGGGALAIFTRNRTSILYGSGTADWSLTPYRDELGAYPYTMQDVAYTVFLDDRGVTSLQTAQTFGNFAHATLSNLIRRLINQQRTKAVASCISRDLSQYRLFFSDKTSLYFTIVGQKVIGIMPMSFPETVRCVVSLEESDGSEEIYFGSDDGWVFQMEKGTSFDGDNIEAYIDLSYSFQGSPRLRKRYRRALIELEGQSYAEFFFGYNLGYGSLDFEQPAALPINLSSVFWDNFTWDNFTWDGSTLVPNAVSLDGTANNISISIRSDSDYFEPLIITGLVLSYTPRREVR